MSHVTDPVDQEASKNALRRLVITKLKVIAASQESVSDSVDISEEIRKAYSNLSPIDAASRIENYWVQLDDQARLAEAKMRLLLPKIPLEIPDNPLTEIVAPEANESIKSVNDTLRHLSRTQLDQPSVEIGVEGNVILGWNFGLMQVHVEFEPTTIPFPGIVARAMMMNENGIQLKTCLSFSSLLAFLHSYA